MQNWIRYDMESNTSERVYMCQQTSKMCSSHPTWESLASVNECRGWCTCIKLAKCKKAVAPGRCVSPTCAHDHLHHPTHVQTWLHFPLKNVGLSTKACTQDCTPCMWTCNAKIRCVDWEVVCLWMSSSLKLCWMPLCVDLGCTSED